MEQPLVFHNADFEKAVRFELQNHDTPVFPADALKVKHLCCADFSFSPEDYETLYCFQNLERLVLEQAEGILDLSLLTPLKNLKELNVGGDIYWSVDLINIGALKELPLLVHLSIGDFRTIDLAEIGSIKQLKELLIGWGNSVTNAQAIKELENLSYLELLDIKIENLDFLQEVSVDVDLSLGGLEITDPFDIGILKRFKKYQYEMICVSGEFI